MNNRSLSKKMSLANKRLIELYIVIKNAIACLASHIFRGLSFGPKNNLVKIFCCFQSSDLARYISIKDI